MNYEEHISKIKSLDTVEILRGLMVDAVNALYNHAEIKDGKIIKLNECNFLKG